jgi:hypothetical protein
MTNVSEADLIGDWRTSSGKIVTINESVTIPEQKVWLGKDTDGRQVFFTREGKPILFNHEVGDLVERRRSQEQIW